MRDDLLGVFGDPARDRASRPATTCARASGRCSPRTRSSTRRRCSWPSSTGCSGGRDLDDDEIQLLREILQDSRAVQACEDLITDRTEDALDALDRGRRSTTRPPAKRWPTSPSPPPPAQRLTVGASSGGRRRCSRRSSRSEHPPDRGAEVAEHDHLEGGAILVVRRSRPGAGRRRSWLSEAITWVLIRSAPARSIASICTMLDTSTCRSGRCVRSSYRGAGTGERLQVFARDPVLLADPDRLQPAVAHIVPDRPHVQAEPVATCSTEYNSCGIAQPSFAGSPG